MTNNFFSIYNRILENNFEVVLYGREVDGELRGARKKFLT